MSTEDNASDWNVDKLIELLLAGRDSSHQDRRILIPEQDMQILCAKIVPVLMSQPMLLEIEAPIKLAGDIHGQYSDLLELFHIAGFPSDSKYLFLGDYVSRGKQSLETICLLFAYKIKYPESLFLLRGNHECGSMSRIYGFYDECKSRYSIRIWKLFRDCFNYLPVAAIISKKIFCCHGGISPDLNNLDQIRQIVRPTDVPDHGLLCDLLWADPDSSVIRWAENDAGISNRFGVEALTLFLNQHNLSMICRAHQVVENGYELFANGQLVTIFSAANYLGSFKNKGGIMFIDENLQYSFTTFESIDHRENETVTTTSDCVNLTSMKTGEDLLENVAGNLNDSLR